MKKKNFKRVDPRYYLIPKVEDIPYEKGMKFMQTGDILDIAEEITEEEFIDLVKTSRGDFAHSLDLAKQSNGQFFLPDGRKLVHRSVEYS